MTRQQHSAPGQDLTFRDDDGYCDLRSYAAIGDGRTVAFVAGDGRIDWLPLPAVDASPAFAAMLDARNGGFIDLRPDEEFTATREYVAQTNVLRTTFRTASGSVAITDALTTGIAGRLPWAELARRIDGLDGTVVLRAEVRPGTCLNTVSPYIEDTHSGVLLRVDGLTMAVRTLHDDGVEINDASIGATYRTSAGSRHLLGLVATADEPLLIPPPEGLDEGVDRTIANWAAWSNSFSATGRWADDVQRSVLTLKLLIQAASGSVVAAPSTSLPESPSGGKNWDYRLAWVRDTAYTLTALFRFGLREETHSAISWLIETVRLHGPEPEVCYRLDGTVPGADVTVYDAPGWRGIGPVVSGNRASGQLQLGVFGDLFSIVQLYVDHGNVVDAGTARLLAEVADLTCDRWRNKDAGMWELTEDRHYVSSKMGCWKALVDAAHLAEIGQLPADGKRWRTEADRICEWIDAEGWSEERGAYVWYPGSQQLDASVLLHAVSGFDRGERMSRTIDVLREELGAGPHLYRYSGVQAEEGAFVACGFWMVSALHLVGRTDEATALMDELIPVCTNDVGMLSELIDPSDNSFWGNLPQALSHLALVNAAITLEEPIG
ncbi:glycoside hydrolase family 15 protein [Nakamurella sp. A5-74]|uniref:Glycoside hydrolase family 15 protein n=1 Tax=Nakamurella sp. A5-74 TaxID=3158264 RepID=A0AAU8DQK1_9ACTN